MFELKRANVHRLVDTEAKRDALIAKGFALVEKAPAGGEGNTPPAGLACPHCGKQYKKQADLDKHIAKEHSTPPAGGSGNTPPAGGEGNGNGNGEGNTPPAGDN